MTSANSQKGNQLEDAVRLIETTILKNNPATKDAILTIEPKKIVMVDDVKHEIDLFITIDFGRGYKSIFIFECKNWEESIGKNEIIVFSEKIDVVQAQKGYFIAKSFGKYALAQAQKDKRIELIEATDEVEALPPFVISAYHIVHENLLHANLSLIRLTNDPQSAGVQYFSDTSRFLFQNREYSQKEFIEHIQKIVKNEVMQHQPTGTFSEGVLYKYDKTKTFNFKRGELFVDEHEYVQLVAQVIWEVQIIRPTIISKFDIKTRGRVIIYEADNLPTGGNITTSFINID